MAYIHKFYNWFFAKTPVNSCAIVYSYFLIVIYSTQGWKGFYKVWSYNKKKQTKVKNI